MSDNERLQEKRLGYAAWIAVCFLWGTGFLATRIGVRSAPPLLFAGLRILLAGLLLVGCRVAAGERLPHRADWLPLVGIGLATEGLCNGVLAWTAQWITSGLLAVLFALTPAWMVVLEAARPGGEPLTPRKALGLAACFLGVVWLVGPQIGGGSMGLRAVIGCLLVQVVCFSYAAGSVSTRHQSLTVKPLMSAGVQMTAAGVGLCVAGTVAGEWRSVSADLPTVLAFLYLLVFGSLIGYSSYVYALRVLPVSTVSLHRYINPVVALFLGWMLLGERISPVAGVGIGLIAAGIIGVQSGSGRVSVLRRPR